MLAGMMRRGVVAALCGAALIATPVTVAYAQSLTGPDTPACRDATALAVTASADVDAVNVRLGVEVKALDTARFLLANATGTAVPFFQGEVRRLETVVAGLRADLGAAQAKVALAVTERDTACAEPAPTTPPTTPPTTTPDTATPTAAPGVDEFDCGDFPLPDGRTAQDVLAADASDPHRLDLDDDGTPCEADDADRPLDDDFDQVGQVPAGSVATGS